MVGSENKKRFRWNDFRKWRLKFAALLLAAVVPGGLVLLIFGAVMGIDLDEAWAWLLPGAITYSILVVGWAWLDARSNFLSANDKRPLARLLAGHGIFLVLLVGLALLAIELQQPTEFLGLAIGSKFCEGVTGGAAFVGLRLFLAEYRWLAFKGKR